MNEKTTTRMLWAAAAVFLIVGTGMTVSNLRKSAGVSERLEKNIADLKTLRIMEADMARYEAAKKMMEKLPDKHPVPLNGLLQETLPASKGDDIRDAGKDELGGWLVRRKEISMNDVPVGKAMEFVQKAESQKLPWCLARCVIRAAPRAGGTGQVVLLMEALEKSE